MNLIIGSTWGCAIASTVAAIIALNLLVVLLAFISYRRGDRRESRYAEHLRRSMDRSEETHAPRTLNVWDGNGHGR